MDFSCGKGQTKGESVRIHRFMIPNEEGDVDNPLRENIAAFMEAERKRRKFRHQDMAELFRNGSGQGLSYRTYIQTFRRKNNVTLKTLGIMAEGLDASIASLLIGKDVVEPWAHKLDDPALRERLALILTRERESRGMSRVDMYKLIGVAEATYQKLERGRDNVSVDTLAAIAKSLKRNPATFLFDPAVPTVD